MKVSPKACASASACTFPSGNVKAAILLFAMIVLASFAGCGGGSTKSGTPAPAPVVERTHSVDLSWNHSSSADVSGYNVYRAEYNSSCGAFARINSTPTTTAAYRDATVDNGASYCYAATAITSGGSESGFSNVVTGVIIPST